MNNFYLIRERNGVPFECSKFNTLQEANLAADKQKESGIECKVCGTADLITCLKEEIQRLESDLIIAKNARIARRKFYKMVKEILEENDISAEDLVEHCLLW